MLTTAWFSRRRSPITRPPTRRLPRRGRLLLRCRVAHFIGYFSTRAARSTSSSASRRLPESLWSDRGHCRSTVRAPDAVQDRRHYSPAVQADHRHSLAQAFPRTRIEVSGFALIAHIGDEKAVFSVGSQGASLRSARRFDRRLSVMSSIVKSALPSGNGTAANSNSRRRPRDPPRSLFRSCVALRTTRYKARMLRLAKPRGKMREQAVHRG